MSNMPATLPLPDVPHDARLSGRLPFELMRMAARLNESVDRHCRSAFGLSLGHVEVLISLSASPMTATHLGRRTGIDKTRISRAVAELKRLDLLIAKTDRDDQRVMHLSLSDDGLRTRAQALALLQRFERDFLNRLSATEKAGLESGLKAMQNDLSDAA